MAVGYACEFLDVEDFASGVGYGLAEEGFGVGAEGFGYFFFGGVGVDEGAVDAEFFECYAKEVGCAAVYVGLCYDVVAGLADVEHGVEVGCLSG